MTIIRPKKMTTIASEHAGSIHKNIITLYLLTIHSIHSKPLHTIC